ncbi:MAG: hypothetical protein Q9214_006962 [Letrouitia sp. 1 TL-2023]
MNDVLSLCVGLWAVKVANEKTSSKMYTYGTPFNASSSLRWCQIQNLYSLWDAVGFSLISSDCSSSMNTVTAMAMRKNIDIRTRRPMSLPLQKKVTTTQEILPKMGLQA